MNRHVHRPLKSGQRHRFTLIELLVVVAIIGILASMLLPVLSRSRQQARRTVCMNNLKQASMAESMYSTDNDSWLLLMRGDHPHHMNIFSLKNEGYFNAAFRLTEYAPATTWFCPEFYMHDKQHPPGHSPIPDDEKESKLAGDVGRVGYMWYRAAWSSGNREPINRRPYVGNGTQNEHIQQLAKHCREIQMTPDAVRAGDFYTHIANYDLSNNDSKHSGWFHLAGATPDGGNSATFDGAVAWYRHFEHGWSNYSFPVPPDN